MCMSDLERIEDQHPELTFWGIEVENPKYHGHIEENNVYINLLQPDILVKNRITRNCSL